MPERFCLSVEGKATALRSLAATIDAACPDIAQVVAQALEARLRIEQTPGDRLHLYAGGTVLHAFYNELEKTFALIAVSLDGFEPRGDDWHARLADMMFIEVPSLRPAVLPLALRSATRELRGFRHLFRHLYVLDLDSARVCELLTKAPALWSGSETALRTFAAVLRDIAAGLEADANDAM